MTPRSRTILRLYLWTAAGTLLWLAALFAAPYLRSRGVGGAGWFYACFAPFCHQIPARSFFPWGFPMAVCVRCFGIYSGFAAGLALYPRHRGFDAVRIPRLRTFILVSAPIVLDTGANVLRLWDTGPVFRFLTGILWGSILPFYFLTGLAQWPAAVRGPGSPFRRRPGRPEPPPVPFRDPKDENPRTHSGSR